LDTSRIPMGGLDEEDREAVLEARKIVHDAMGLGDEVGVVVGPGDVLAAENVHLELGPDALGLELSDLFLQFVLLKKGTVRGFLRCVGLNAVGVVGSLTGFSSRHYRF